MKMEKEVRKISKMQAQCSDTKVEVKRHARQIQNRRLTESHKKRHQITDKIMSEGNTEGINKTINTNKVAQLFSNAGWPTPAAQILNERLANT